MQKAANFARGWVEARITGADPEEFLNRCARDNIPFWRVRREGELSLTLRTSALWWKELKKLGQGGRWEVKEIRRGGLPGLLRGVRRRYGLLAGGAAAVIAVAVLSRFVLSVQVSGNIRVPTEAILTQLRLNGVKPGVYGPSLDTRDISHRVILELPQLSWVAINLHGTVADVLVREGSPTPELMEEDEPAHVTAKYPGIISHMDVYRGMALVEEGDTVAAGDTLISGWVEFPPPAGSSEHYEGYLVRAAGRVWARTWHTLKASIPLTGEEKAPTGARKTRWSVEILGRRVNFYRNSRIPFEKYDRIAVYHIARLPNGTVLPLSLRKETLSEYETRMLPINGEKGEALLKNQLQERLARLAGKGEVRRTDYKTERRDGLLTVTLLAECVQEIGQTIED